MIRFSVLFNSSFGKCIALRLANEIHFLSVSRSTERSPVAMHDSPVVRLLRKDPKLPRYREKSIKKLNVKRKRLLVRPEISAGKLESNILSSRRSYVNYITPSGKLGTMVDVCMEKVYPFQTHQDALLVFLQRLLVHIWTANLSESIFELFLDPSAHNRLPSGVKTGSAFVQFCVIQETL